MSTSPIPLLENLEPSIKLEETDDGDHAIQQQQQQQQQLQQQPGTSEQALQNKQQEQQEHKQDMDFSFCAPKILSLLQSPPLAHMDLRLMEVEDWFIIQRSRFDFQAFNEPYRAIQLFLHSENGNFLQRLFTRTFQSGYISTSDEFISLCFEVFDSVVPCLGFFDLDHLENEEDFRDFLTLEFPFRRKVSKNCIQAYRLESTNPSVTESLGIGLCSGCLSEDEDSEEEDDEDEDDSYASDVKSEGSWGNLGLAGTSYPFEVDRPKKRKRRSHTRSTSSRKGKHDIKPDPDSHIDSDGHQLVFEKKLEKGKVRYLCPYCDQTYNSLSGVRHHAGVRHYYGKFTCSICENYKSIYAYNLFEHMITAHKDTTPSVNCFHCKEKELSDVESFREHYLACVLAAFRKRNREKARRWIKKPNASRSRDVQCDICGKTFSNNYLLVDHKNGHLGIKPYKCDEEGCDFATPIRSSLNGHKQIHLRQKGIEITETNRQIVHPCDLCGKKYAQRSQMMKHRRKIHEGYVETHKCEICGEVFPGTKSKTKHKMLVHKRPDEIDQFRCKICDNYYPGFHELRRHMKSHEDPKCVCRYCGKALKRMETLREHERSHTGEHPYKCPFCEYVAKSSTVLRKHSLSKHPELVGGPRKRIVIKPELLDITDDSNHT